MSSQETRKGQTPGVTESSWNSHLYQSVPGNAVNFDTVNRSVSLRRTFQVSWMDRRTDTEKKMMKGIIFLVICVVVLFLVLVAILVKLHQTPPSSSCTENESSLPVQGVETFGETCITWPCVQTAWQLQVSINRSVDPCEDFFQFACGSSLPDMPRQSSHIEKIGDDVNEAIEALLKEPVSTGDIKAVQKVKVFYRSCIITSGRLQASKTDLAEFLFLKAFGKFFPKSKGWPIQESDWKESGMDLAEFTANLRFLTDKHGLFTFYVEADAKNADANILYFDQRRFLRPPYFNMTRDAIFLNISGNHKDNTTLDMMREIYNIDKELRELMVASRFTKNHSLLYNRMTVEDMHTNLTEEFDWLRYLRRMFHDTDIKIDLDEPVVVLAPEYFVKLGQLLKRTSPLVLANYLSWQWASDPFDSWSSHLHTAVDQLNRFTGEVPFSSEFDLESCLTLTKELFGLVVSRMFIDRHFNSENQKTVNELVTHIKEAFYELIDESQWLPDTSKELVKDKIEFINSKIGYPEYLLDDELLNKYYSDVHIDEKNFTESIFSIARSAASEVVSRLRYPVDRSVWVVLPIIVNAYYIGVRNEIVIPASIIRPPFFRETNSPRALNFGSLGFVIGHEIAHSLGIKGSQYDKGGNLTTWLPDQTITKFLEQTTCLVDQYNAYANVNVNGSLTLGEDIADNSGVRQTYRAYRKWVEKNGKEEPRLPGLNMSGNQLFFLHLAQAMCSTENQDQSTTSGRSTGSSNLNDHSPANIRIIGALSNFREFSEAFGCRSDSRMNPTNKCIVW